MWEALATKPERRHRRLVTAAAYAYSAVVYVVLFVILAGLAGRDAVA
jgi:hypothetical protein